MEVPGMAKLNRRGFSLVTSLSCPGVGECVAGGNYVGRSGKAQVFVARETSGHWEEAIELPGIAKLNTDGNAGLDSISCGAPGNCAAAGFYYRHGLKHAFLASETSGHWRNATEVPGLAKLNRGGSAETYSVSCAAAGECAAGGYYTSEPPDYRSEAFVVSERNGRWGTAIEVPGTPTLNTGGDAAVNSISCPAPGECGAAGYYTDGSGALQVFVVDETSGSWGDAIEVPATASLNAGGDDRVSSISCPAVGECAAGGYYTDGSGHRQAFVVDEAGGTWGDAIELPGSGPINHEGGDAEVGSISCATAGNCAAAGFFGGCCDQQVLVATETNGSWGNAVAAPPGTASNDYNVAAANAISCAPAGECTAGGFTIGGDPNWYNRAVVVSETNGNWANAVQLLKFQALCFVPDVVGQSIGLAMKKLAAAYCSVGKIASVHSDARKGRVVSQRPKSGALLNARARVAVTVSNGGKR
jgi:hypothetical protein